MRFLLLTGAVLALIGAACGGGSTSAEGVVRAWSSAVNAGDNETAADQFATNAEIVQGGIEQRFRTRADAVDWNAARKEILSQADLQFDPDVVAAFEDTEQDLREIRREFSAAA